ncbi:Stk1 family PASTA domain-containing Ser/Thr kinase [Actinotalea sp. K2]|uniref:Stk1 family PASTA domain-containing Ser/Thr kinase n=1 Tax=Actinotalea sp. K2 TaxID=2939438 RepID=UPI0027E0CECC|nr:Stk1 family PASTA domain-containing Ser/Thr kinase [Actinotalea sp. K2]
MDDAPRILGGRYEVGELIGRGGMAEVHIGHDTRLGRTVAIKILRSDLARDPSFQARFRREAQAAASLNHPSIVAVYDTGEDVFTEHAGGVSHVPFIVMEYVEGHTVRDILRDGSAVPIEEAAEITSGVLSALEYSHHAGIVHRDIKPANVMLTPTGAVKVMDFGIARAMADSAATMTQTQAVIGTAQYLSPEQARGETVDSRSDLYSTGCLLFELLTGRPPFTGDSPVAVAYQHVREQAQPPSTYASDVPEALDRITMKALTKDREDRYSTAAEFRADLESAVRGGHVNAPALGALGAAAMGAAAADRTQVLGQTNPDSTQVFGASGATGATQVVPAAAPWAQVSTETPGGPPAEEDDEPNRRWLLWTLIAVAVIAVIGIVWLLLRGSGDETPPATVEFPDLVGVQEDDARAQVADLDLEIVWLLEASDLDPGLVSRSDPEGGQDLPVGTEVEIYVSQGPEALTIPELTNFTQADARARLEQLGFTGDILTEVVDSPDVLEGAVTGTTPGAGEAVAPDTSITLLLSSGNVELPDLTGQTQEQARQTLLDLGLLPTFTQEESDAAVGTVIRQSRSPGPVPQRSDIEVIVAIERSPEQIPVPDVTDLRRAQAEERMGGASLNTTVREQASDSVEAGRVITTEPGPNALVNEGSSVVLVISTGPATPPNDGGGDDNEDD